MKKLLLLCFFISYNFSFAYAQLTTDTLQKNSENNKKNNTLTLTQTHTLTINKAKSGDVKAMYEAGLQYRFGMGVTIDLLRAFDFIKRAAEHGNTNALYMLGEMYKDGIGIKQDYPTAYQIFSKKALRNDYRANTTLAYMLYKGLGCKQNYNYAYELFLKEAEYGNVNCMYYVGLCFRNGYGVAQNYKAAKKWLKLAGDKGDKQSISELAISQPENYLPPTNNDNKSFINSYNKYQNVQQNITLTDISGNYGGILYKYDWSGQYVVEKNAITLTLNKTNIGYTGTLEEDGNNIPLTATLSDEGLQFKNSIYKKIDRYSGGKAEAWEITNAQLQLVTERDSTYIVGNITMYSNDRREPSKPYLLKITKLPIPNLLIKVVDTAKQAFVIQKKDTIAKEDVFIKRPSINVARYNVTSDSVEIRFFDDGNIDGDEISLIYNNKKIGTKISLKASAYIIKIPVVKGQINKLSIFAENLGTIPPATAFLRIIFDRKEIALNISSDFSRSDSIEFVNSETANP